MEDVKPEVKKCLYRFFQSAAEITYEPEAALKEGLNIVKTLKGDISKLELGSQLRRDVWNREIERYRSRP